MRISVRHLAAVCVPALLLLTQPLSAAPNGTPPAKPNGTPAAAEGGMPIDPNGEPSAAPAQHAGPPTVEEAEHFIAEAEKRLTELSIESGRASWVQSNFITSDTEALAAKANERLIEAGVELAM